MMVMSASVWIVPGWMGVVGAGVLAPLAVVIGVVVVSVTVWTGPSVALVAAAIVVARVWASATAASRLVGRAFVGLLV